MKKIIEKIITIRKISLRITLTIVGALLAPAVAFAVVQTLNGATGQTQTFVNDNNVTVTTNTTANTHTFGWSGLLPVSRGGTGAGSFTAGSVLFSNGASISQDNSNLFWDNSNDILKVQNLLIGTGYFGPDSESSTIRGLDATAMDTQGKYVRIRGGVGLGSGPGGAVIIEGGHSSDTGNGGNLHLEAAAGGINGGNGGSVFIAAAEAPAGDDNGGSIEFSSGLGHGNGVNGNYKFFEPSGNWYGVLDFESITANRTFTFPNFSGTFGLLENDQTWTGLNKFESIASSSIYIGSPTKSGCIVMGDSDGSGVTYITVNDGIPSYSTTKPGICQ